LENELKEKKARLMKENEDKSDYLDLLDKDIEALLTSTLPLQEKLNIGLTKQKTLIDAARFLPSPLFSLYQQCLGFIELSGKIY
jgi:hypothetical protein